MTSFTPALDYRSSDVLRGFSALSSRLFEPLYTRACARSLWPDCGFKDDAAEVLVDRLENRYYKWLEHTPNERENIARCRWFDERCLAFFERHPKGMGIQLGSGINTRFHRLCHKLSWPAFTWVDIDEPKAVAIASEVLPLMDNYTLLADDLDDSSWLVNTGWSKDQALIIVIEESFINHHHIKPLLTALLSSRDSHSLVHILFDSSQRQDALKRIEQVGLDTDTTTIDNIAINHEGFISRYFSWLPSVNTSVGVEVRLTSV